MFLFSCPFRVVYKEASVNMYINGKSFFIELLKAHKEAAKASSFLFELCPPFLKVCYQASMGPLWPKGGEGFGEIPLCIFFRQFRRKEVVGLLIKGQSD